VLFNDTVCDIEWLGDELEVSDRGLFEGVRNTIVNLSAVQNSK
jgi:hypothetical protein